MPSSNKARSAQGTPGVVSTVLRGKVLTMAGGAGEASAMRIPNRLMPIPPRGTSQSAKRCRERRSQSREPQPMPMVNIASNRVTEVSLPPSTCRA